MRCSARSIEELVGLAPVKARIRQIAALLLVDSARARFGLTTTRPNLHMCFTGRSGHGQDHGRAAHGRPAASASATCERGHLVAVGRDDLVGQYVGHTAPKTKEVLKRAMGGVLFIDEAYYLYRAENERDYGQESIEILLQVMENQREDLVVILAGYKDRMDTFFQANPGMSSRIAHHIDFPDYTLEELEQIGILMVDPGRLPAVAGAPAPPSATTSTRRRQQPRFANARSVRNALERARLRHASRLFDSHATQVSRDDLIRLEPEDFLASRVFPSPPRTWSTMPDARKTLTRHTIEAEHRHPDSTGDFSGLLNAVSTAVKMIANQVNKGALVGAPAARNEPGEVRKRLGRAQQRDPDRRDRMGRPPGRDGLGGDGRLLPGPGPVPARQVPARVRPAGRLRRHRRQHVAWAPSSPSCAARDPGAQPQAADFLQPGTEQVCAGFALYGPSTMLVLTTGDGVDGFTLDRDIGAFVLTHPQMRIPAETSEFAINSSNERFWEPPVRRYVAECLAGRDRPARQGLHHAVDRLAGRRGVPHPQPRRRVPVPRRQQGPASRAGCG